MTEIPDKVDDALARAVLDGLPYDKVRDNLTVADVAHALAAVSDALPAARPVVRCTCDWNHDPAFPHRSWCALNDPPAARPVVDRMRALCDRLDRIAEDAEWQYEHLTQTSPADKKRRAFHKVRAATLRETCRDIRAIIASGVVQDAVDVRRAMAEEVARMLRSQATQRFEFHGPHDARWAADFFGSRVELVDDGDMVTLDVDLLPPLEHRIGLLLLAAGEKARVLSPARLLASGPALARELLEHHRGTEL
jgi:hypothetical protein